MPRYSQRSRCATVVLSFVAIGSFHSVALGELVRQDDAPRPKLVRTTAIDRVIGTPPADSPAKKSGNGECKPVSYQSYPGDGGDGYEGGYEVSDDGNGAAPYAGDYGGSCSMGCGSGCDSGCGPSCGSGPYGGSSCGPSCGASYGPSCGAPYRDDCGDYCPDMRAECRPRAPRCMVFGEFLYLQVTDADVTHAQQQNGIGGAGTVPFGEIGTIGQDFNPAFRVGAGVACGACSGVGVSFTHFESDVASSLSAPVITGGGGAVGSLVHHPGAALTASAGPVNATYEIDFQLADIMWRRVMRGDRFNLGFSAGVEVGHLEQGFSQFGIFGGGQGGAIDTTTSIDFDGAGLKLGVDGENKFANGLGIYGRLTAAALTGRFDSDYSMFNDTTDEQLALANWTDDRVIGHIEYELGVSCTSCNDRWRIAGGYMFSYWTNVVTTPELIDAVQADNYTDVGDTIGFNGLVSRIECRW